MHLGPYGPTWALPLRRVPGRAHMSPYGPIVGLYRPSPGPSRRGLTAKHHSIGLGWVNRAGLDRAGLGWTFNRLGLANRAGLDWTGLTVLG